MIDALTCGANGWLMLTVGVLTYGTLALAGAAKAPSSTRLSVAGVWPGRGRTVEIGVPAI